jgi:hypothetical protein
MGWVDIINDNSKEDGGTDRNHQISLVLSPLVELPIYSEGQFSVSSAKKDDYPRIIENHSTALQHLDSV